MGTESKKLAGKGGVNATPCFVVNGARYGGTADYGSLRSALEEQLDDHV